MNIVIAGGTGLIGSALVNYFVQSENHVYIATRSSGHQNTRKNVTYVTWDELEKKTHSLPNIDVVINLAGQSLNNGRWNRKQKEQILSSRLQATKNCIALMKKLEVKPKVFLNASAIGFYGTSTSESYTEQVQTPGTDFLATVCEKWEHEAVKAKELGIRTALLRFGVVLATNGGALPLMALPYKLYAGGTVGSGQQWVSWIHLEDAVRLIDFIIQKPSMEGPINITAPEPVQMKSFGQTLAKVLQKPHWFPTPSFLLQGLLGERSLLVLKGQNVTPQKALEYNFQFTHPTLEKALENLY